MADDKQGPPIDPLELAETVTGSADRPSRPPAPVESTPAAAPAHVLPVIPGYEIVRELGRGGMGVVYEALQKSTSQRVALKMIVPQAPASDKALQLFLREASTLSQLRHPRIVRFIELGLVGGELFLTMEYVDAIDLRATLAQASPENRVRTYCGVACQVLEALACAHDLGLVHRDIKPSNILVARAGRMLEAKLGDFGLAKNYQTAGLTKYTRDGEVRGTELFMPPEQWRDARYAKPTADIYAVGVTLYYYLADRPPFSTTTLRSWTQRPQEPLDPVSLADLRPDLPPDLIAVIHRAMAHRPEDRFASAAEFRQALLPFARRPAPPRTTK